ncbi:hypothetical protein IQ269_03070 [Tychonema sp. LEGE 07199]|uniref:hypothetical protein n=1 Tax=unclassified Tychonema TaxID=2642144 RepID=UPI00187F9560|nr:MULTISPECIES: hypothetical protein [unclassified Tychonema]MBE9119810.1 hypothetical protein [Tychonema sp. LEGE 07199]MBE9132183.1 hypothetical protein [Tychonema sp. LEGE 07196]
MRDSLVTRLGLLITNNINIHSQLLTVNCFPVNSQQPTANSQQSTLNTQHSTIPITPIFIT